ncbi:uncharacterized protein LOC130736840 [Lotus japonicus]|uniref:uncharacterized protein LOC130736840 n=1 Tax=Lotus japonicus TaxID=34305 RepID=UPI00258BDF06|nr:uncharacterized protein LOC130736840 [Lotus japonicus]
MTSKFEGWMPTVIELLENRLNKPSHHIFSPFLQSRLVSSQAYLFSPPLSQFHPKSFAPLASGFSSRVSVSTLPLQFFPSSIPLLHFILISASSSTNEKDQNGVGQLGIGLSGMQKQDEGFAALSTEDYCFFHLPSPDSVSSDDSGIFSPAARSQSSSSHLLPLCLHQRQKAQIHASVLESLGKKV